jgi:hypothetical protein
VPRPRFESRPTEYKCRALPPDQPVGLKEYRIQSCFSSCMCVSLPLGLLLTRDKAIGLPQSEAICKHGYSPFFISGPITEPYSFIECNGVRGTEEKESFIECTWCLSLSSCSFFVKLVPWLDSYSTNLWDRATMMCEPKCIFTGDRAVSTPASYPGDSGPRISILRPIVLRLSMFFSVFRGKFLNCRVS